MSCAPDIKARVAVVARGTAAGYNAERQVRLLGVVSINPQRAPRPSETSGYNLSQLRIKTAPKTAEQVTHREIPTFGSDTFERRVRAPGTRTRYCVLHWMPEYERQTLLVVRCRSRGSR
jgi:hypothetical protein